MNHYERGSMKPAAENIQTVGSCSLSIAQLIAEAETCTDPERAATLYRLAKEETDAMSATLKLYLAGRQSGQVTRRRARA